MRSFVTLAGAGWPLFDKPYGSGGTIAGLQTVSR